MIVKVYGSLDENPCLMQALEAYALSLSAESLTVVAHARKPLNARHCQQPGSLTYEFILNGSNQAQAARQTRDGRIYIPFKG